MKKILKGLICVGLVGAVAAGTIGAAGCKNSNPGSGGQIEYRNTETSPLRLAIGAVDEKFNPMFFTSANDGVIASLTQASLITADAQGNLAYGEDQPTVALDYLETYYGAEDAVLATGDGVKFDYAQGQTSASVSANASYTTYEFLIKNGMMFSDGVHPLTVMDVLFNLYVYLDPLYSGSSTIYSTKIEGLQAYRQNNPAASDDSQSASIDLALYGKAETRYTNLYRWAAQVGGVTTYDEHDLEKVSKLYEEKLNSDWNAVATSYVEGYKEYNFDAAWKAFVFMEDIIKVQTRQNEAGAIERVQVDGKYLTDLDPDWQTGQISSRGQSYIDYMENAFTEAQVDALVAQGMSRENAILSLQKTAIIDFLYENNTNPDSPSGIASILAEGSFASRVVDAFYQEEVSAAAKSKEQKVFSIRGITVSHSNTFNGKTYDEDHDILKIKVKGVDPKAKWNFGFAVAPMYYYSDEAHYNAAYGAETSDYKTGKVYDGTATNFGVEYSDIDFINNVLSASSKNGVPMGAGPYKCCTYQYGQSGLSASTFFYNYMAFFERNTQFETMGAGIENAKIKYVTYKVTNDDLIVSSLVSGEIDYGEPIATSTNRAETNHMATTTYETGGYGYVGINPKAVKDITIRRAIMMAFDTTHIVDYYGRGLVDIINRPMSNTSWVWDYADRPTSSYYGRARTAKNIIDYIEGNSNWVYSGGTWSNSSTGENGVRFTYSFTIAGETTDHPAYTMFTYAKTLLEQAGFSISVGTRVDALQALVTGNLEVWAAAWSSSIDPDPYQIYSLYSNASSTKNWNKDNIVAHPDQYPTEYAIATALNEKIIAGRQTLDPEQRSMIYAHTTSKNSYETMSALDLIMELAVEFPTYQRRDLCVWNGNVLDSNTMRTGDEATHNMGPISELWKVNYHIRPVEEEPENGAN